MDGNVIMWGGILIATILVLVGGYYGVPKLRGYLKAKGIDPKMQDNIDRLIDLGIMAAFRAEQKAAAEFGTWLAGVEKKQIADSVYNLFVDKYGDTAIGGFLAQNIPKETFARWVQEGYDRFVEWYNENQEHFEKMIADFADG